MCLPCALGFYTGAVRFSACKSDSTFGNASSVKFRPEISLDLVAALHQLFGGGGGMVGS